MLAPYGWWHITGGLSVRVVGMPQRKAGPRLLLGPIGTPLEKQRCYGTIDRFARRDQ